MKKMLVLFLCVHSHLYTTNVRTIISDADTQLTDAIIGISNDFQAMQDIPKPVIHPPHNIPMTIKQYLEFLEAQLSETKRYALRIIDYCDRAADKLVIAKECVKENSGQ